MMEEATEQAAPAFVRDEIDVTDEFRAPLATFQHDLAAVEGFKLGAMGDADHGGLGQLLGHDLHHLVLALFIERRIGISADQGWYDGGIRHPQPLKSGG